MGSKRKKRQNRSLGNTKGDAIQAERSWVAKHNVQRKEMNDDKNGRRTSDSVRKHGWKRHEKQILLSNQSHGCLC
jgi:hypothetical protein